MARKPAAKKPTVEKPKFKLTDKIAAAEKKLIKKAKNDQESLEKGEKVKKTYQKSQLDFARRENAKIQAERGSKIHPLVIEMYGQRTPVVDPNGIWAFRTPPILRSPTDMIAYAVAKNDPTVLGVIDFETWQLLAGVMHHMVALRFTDDGKLLTDENRADVQFLYDYDAVDQFFCDMMVELINKCRADPSLSKEGKIWAHNGANFDFVGYALSIGIDRSTTAERKKKIIAKDENGDDKEYKITYEIKTFSGKPRLLIKAGVSFRILLVDSYHILPVSVSALGAKGVTPLQFTNPLKWINGHTSKVTGEAFALTERDVRPYLYLAHKRSLESFRGTGELSDVAFEGIELWKSTLVDPNYSCDDAIILVNALKRFAAKFRTFAQPLAKLLGQDAVDSMRPFSYNTSSTAGFALSVAYWYESRLEMNEETGVIGLKKSIAFQQKKQIYALVDTGMSYGKILSPEELQEELTAGTKIQRHGIVKHRERVLIEYPVWTRSIDNRFSRMAQNGSQTTVFAAIAHAMMEVDSNSAFPAAMARGCEKMTVKDGYMHDGKLIGKSNGPVKINALLGFEDTGYRCSMPTKAMIDSGMATPERMLNEQGVEVTMWVVRGRQKILHMLDLRNGEFTVILPPSKFSVLATTPGTSIRTPGRGLDSRLVNPRISQPVMMVLRGSAIASHACHPTVDDDAMVIYLCEVGINEQGRTTYRDRSQHGPITGIAMDATGKIFGTPHMHHKKFVEIVYNTRLSEKKLAREARAAGQIALAEQWEAEATMSKLILNGGSYGTYAQNKKPEVDFDLTNLEECVDVIDSLAGLDPAWTGMLECVKKLTPNYKFSEEDDCSWVDLYESIRQFGEQKDAIVESGKLYAIDNITRLQTSAFRQLFTAWADNQITSFTSYSHKSTQVDENGDRIIQTRGIITSAEETAAHAIRPYASEVVAKAAINLHMGQVAIESSPFGLAYSDTDSLHAETGVIKPFDNEKAISLVRAECEKAYGSAPDDHVAGLQRLMTDEGADRDRIFLGILGIYGLSCGEGLGQWGLEEHKYAKGLVSPVMDGKSYMSWVTYYLGPKVYIDTDKHGNAARTKVRSIPKLNPLHPAVLEGYVTSIPSLADRRGLDQENFRAVKLDSHRDVKFGNKKRRVTTLFSSPRRKYPDTNTSVPFDLAYSPEVAAQILAGKMYSAHELARDAMRSIGLDEELQNIRGLEDAYMMYTSQVKIQGRSFDDVSREVSEEIFAKHRLINSQRLSENVNPDERLLIASRDVDEDYLAHMAEWDELAKTMEEREANERDADRVKTAEQRELQLANQQEYREALSESQQNKDQ